MFKMIDEDADNVFLDTITFPRDRTRQPCAQSHFHITNRINNRRRNSISPILIVSDSMVRNVYNPEKEPAGRVGVVPFSGAWAAEVFCY